MTEIALRFDYGGLAGGVATEVARRTREIKALTQRAAADIVTIGDELAAVKAALPHGQWGTWLRVEFCWSEPTAQRMMRVAEKFKTVTVTDLEFSPTALYLLSSDDVPEAARAEAVTEAKAGKPVTPAKAKEIVARHSTAPGFPKGYAPHGTGKKAKKPKAAPTPSTNGAVPHVTPPAPAKPPAVPVKVTAGDLLPRVTSLQADVKKVGETIDGTEFNKTQAGRCCDLLTYLLTGEEAPYRIVKGGDEVAQADAIYEAYPRKVAPDAAKRAIKAALKKVGFDELLKAVREFASSPKGQGDYCPHPATWFNEGRWNDDRREWQRGESKGARRIGAGERFDPNAGPVSL